MPYTLMLLRLECVAAQEMDGDEIMIRLNGNTVWTWERLARTMHHQARASAHVRVVDFVEGRAQDADGWSPLPGSDPAALVFSGLTGDTTVQLWESDRGNPVRGDDDLLGELVVGEEAADLGEVTMHFDQAGAQYSLTYSVTRG